MTTIFAAFHRDLMTFYRQPGQPSFNAAYRWAATIAREAGRAYPSRESARAHLRKTLRVPKAVA